MASLQELFVDLNRRHMEASTRNDLNAISKMVNEYEALLNMAPGGAVILFGLGTCKLQLGLNGSAITYFTQALEALPDSAEIWNNLGSAWKAENDNEKAKECFTKALSLKEHPDYYNNLATLHVNEGHPELGIPLCEKGLQMSPDQPRLHWNYSLLLLEQGKWKEGFDHYEYGLLSHDRPIRYYHGEPEKVPFWNGEKKGRVVVYGEQGMGDEIMFASCLPDLIKEATDVIYDCHPRMIGLFERSFPGLKCYPTRKTNEITWPNDDPPDYKLAIGSLFKRYRADGVFPKKPYLKPDPVRVELYKEKLRALGPGPYVGISWRAGGKKTNAHHRSFKLKSFMPILEQGGTFVSLQYIDEDGKTERFFEETGIQIHHWPEVVESIDDESKRHPGYDYDETAALVAALDLCIVPNTTIVHLCGAIGQTCWTLTPNAVAWRYQLQGPMPMYGDWIKQYREGSDWKWAFLIAARDYGLKYLQAAA